MEIHWLRKRSQLSRDMKLPSGAVQMAALPCVPAVDRMVKAPRTRKALCRADTSSPGFVRSAAGQGDVARLHPHAGGRGVGADDGQERIGGQGRGLVGLGTQTHLGLAQALGAVMLELELLRGSRLLGVCTLRLFGFASCAESDHVFLMLPRRAGCR